jgi:hypothetical protein
MQTDRLNSKITEKEYHKLCNYCDYIMKERENSLVATSVSALHIIREHPQFMKKYQLLLNNTFSSKVKKICFIIFGWIQNIFFSIRRGKNVYLSPSLNGGSLDILFISHMLNNEYGKKNIDFYFDTIPYLMQADGINSGIALINHTKTFKPSFFSRSNIAGVKLFLLTKQLTLRFEIRFIFDIIKEFFIIRKIRPKTKDSNFERLLMGVSYDCFTKNTINSLRLNEQIKFLVKKYNPKVMIITYEGHAWERIVMSAARESCPTIKCIGYQHSVVFRLQHAISRNLSARFNPDTILCSGLVGKRQLDKYESLKNIPKFILGSNRAIKVDDKSHESDLNAKRGLETCLVIPEGDIDECNILFEFSINCARLYSHITFIWRLHPLVTFEKLIRRNKKMSKLPQNIILSSETLTHDIERCSSALYRGTTAVIAAAHKGLKPIYLAIEGEMSIDPLYEINNPSDYVYTEIDFKNMFDQHLTLDLYEKMKEYCSKMFQPLDYNILKHQFTF